MADTTWDQLASEHTPRTRTATVCVRGDLVDRAEQLRVQIREAEEAAGDSLLSGTKELRDELERIRQEAKGFERAFVFKSLGHRWHQLMAEHAPTEEQRKQGRRFNSETFIPAAILKCCTSPEGITEERVSWLMENFNEAQIGRLFLAAMDANEDQGDIPKGVPVSGGQRSTGSR